MKILNKTIVGVALVTLIFSSNLFAQKSANGSATVNVHLQKGLTIVVVDDVIDFPDYIAAGDNGSSSVTVGTGAGANFEVTGKAGKNVTITFNDATSMPINIGVILLY